LSFNFSYFRLNQTVYNKSPKFNFLDKKPQIPALPGVETPAFDLIVEEMLNEIHHWFFPLSQNQTPFHVSFKKRDLKLAS